MMDESQGMDSNSSSSHRYHKPVCGLDEIRQIAERKEWIIRQDHVL